MKKPTLAGYIKGVHHRGQQKPAIGPFVTISRQFGCCGYELADLLAQKINESSPVKQWSVYSKEILVQLAEQSGFSLEEIEKARTEKTGFIQEILRNVRINATPDTFQVRSQIAMIVRDICSKGHAIVVGQGGAAATSDMENGLSVRIEAPEDWRVQRVCRRDNVDKERAIEQINEVERARDYLRQTYAQINPRIPAFNLTIDNSVFTTEQIAEQILLAMGHCRMCATLFSGGIGKADISILNRRGL